MKHILITTIAAVLLAGCGPPKPPDISIHKAAEEGNIEAVKQHLAAGGDANEKGARMNSTPLHWAVVEGHKEVAELLIAKGADVNTKGSGYTPLHLAAEKGYKEIVKLLIDNGADVNVKGDLVGSTPLHLAKTKAVIELLIAKGADVNAKNDAGRAAIRKHGGESDEAFGLDDVERMLSNTTVTGEEKKQSAKTEKATQPIAEVVKPEPTTTKAPDISIQDAAFEGDIEAVKQRLAAGEDVNAKNDLGSTPLHWASTKEIAELLIAKGADVNAKIKLGEYKGQTPLDIATHPDNPKDTAETADLLRKHGAKTGAELKAEGN